MPVGRSADVQSLLDRQAILDCVYRYSRGVDRHDDALLASVFHEDAIDQHGDAFIGGVDDFVQWANHSVHNDHLAHTHHITCHFAEIDEGVAHAESYVFTVGLHKSGKVKALGGRYIDRFERRNGAWRIAIRRPVRDWRFDAEAEVDGLGREGANGGFPRGRWDRNDLSYWRDWRAPVAGPLGLEERGENGGQKSDRLSPDVRYLLDRQDILDCVRRSARGLDRHDPEILASAFHPDAFVEYGPYAGSLPKFLELMTEITAEASSRTHGITCHFAEIRGNVAHAESYVLAVSHRSDGKSVSVIGSRYIDRLEQRSGQWRISRRRVVREWRFGADSRMFKIRGAGETDDGGSPPGRRDRSGFSHQLDPHVASPPGGTSGGVITTINRGADEGEIL